MYFEIYQSLFRSTLQGEPQWRWRLKSANHEIIATGESYTRKEHCLDAIMLLMTVNQLTPIIEK